MKQPRWPAAYWTDLTDQGRAVVERGFIELKTSGRYERGSRVSAEDYFQSVVAFLVAGGRADLVNLPR